MHPARGLLLVLGLAVFIFGVYLLFFEADLDRWISIGLLTAGVVIFVGVVIIGFAGGASEERDHGRDRDYREREVVREPRGGGGGVSERRYRR